MKRRQNVLIILFVIAIMAVYTGYEANKPQPIDCSPNFSISKKSPYGPYRSSISRPTRIRTDRFHPVWKYQF